MWEQALTSLLSGADILAPAQQVTIGGAVLSRGALVPRTKHSAPRTSAPCKQPCDRLKAARGLPRSGAAATHVVSSIRVARSYTEYLALKNARFTSAQASDSSSAKASAGTTDDARAGGCPEGPPCPTGKKKK